MKTTLRSWPLLWGACLIMMGNGPQGTEAWQPGLRLFQTSRIPQRQHLQHPPPIRRQRLGDYNNHPGHPPSTTTARPVLQGMGVPSHPGWKSGRLNRLTDWADNQQPNRPVICEYHPSGRWLWLKWRGTVLRATWRSVVLAMCLSLLVDRVVRTVSGGAVLSVPTAEDAFIRRLGGVKKLWEYQLTLATFILTFFLSHAFTYWQKVYNTTRMIQGRINDFCMLLNMGATRGRDPPSSSEERPTVNGHVVVNNKAIPVARSNASTIPKRSRGFSAEGETLVNLCTRLIRMSHTFFWAATNTASNGLNDSQEYLDESAQCPVPVNGDLIGPVLLSPYGLKATVNAGLLTNEEKEALTGTGLPPSQYAYVLLVWVGIHCMDGFADGSLRGGPGFEENLFRQLAALRASMFDIDDFRAGRMPLAYVQLVQVMVDSLVWMSPFALYPELGILSTALTGLLALFFRGLLALSKSFLDPFGVEGYQEQNIRVDVLVSELNFGAAKRWNYAAGFVPRPPPANTNGTPSDNSNNNNNGRNVNGANSASSQPNGAVPSRS